MDNTFIPRRLNDGWKIAWFDLDVALPFVAIFATVGLVIAGAIMGAVI